MERKTIEIFLPYNEKGETKQKCFNIGFISNRMDREYREMTGKVFEVRRLSVSLNNCIKKQAEIVTSKVKVKERLQMFKALKEDQEQIEAKIESLGTEDFFSDRVALAIKIIEANGIKDDEVMTQDFWDEKVLPGDFVEFLDAVISKDYTEKKKPLTILTKTS